MLSTTHSPDLAATNSTAQLERTPVNSLASPCASAWRQ
jgi:hypothetical protein